MSRSAIAVALMALCGCPPPASVPRDATGARRSYQLLRTGTRAGLATDAGSFLNEIHIGELPAHFVTKGESPYLERSGAKAWLSGSSDAADGWWVDTFILLEIMDEAGHVLRTAAVGYTDPLVFSAAQVPTLGRRSFHFEAKEIEVTSFLPEHGRFKLLATVFSYLGAGKVSDVFLTLDATPPRPETGDLRER